MRICIFPFFYHGMHATIVARSTVRMHTRVIESLFFWFPPFGDLFELLPETMNSTVLFKACRARPQSKACSALRKRQVSTKAAPSRAPSASRLQQISRYSVILSDAATDASTAVVSYALLADTLATSAMCEYSVRMPQLSTGGNMPSRAPWAVRASGIVSGSGPLWTSTSACRQRNSDLCK